MGCYSDRRVRAGKPPFRAEGAGHSHSQLSVIAAFCLPSELPVCIRPHRREACLINHSRMPLGIWILSKSKNLVPAPNLQLSFEVRRNQNSQEPQWFHLPLGRDTRETFLTAKIMEIQNRLPKKTQGGFLEEKIIPQHVWFMCNPGGKQAQNRWPFGVTCIPKIINICFIAFSNAFNKNPQTYGRTERWSHTDPPPRIYNVKFWPYLFYLGRWIDNN